MFSFRNLVAVVPLLNVALAQSIKVAFTSVPAVVVAGNSYNISWGGGDGTAVTITLREGDPKNLDTVGTLVDNAPGYWWVWQVSKTLNTSSDYALQITQGQSDINYSGPFALVGGAGTSTISYSGLTTATGNSTSTMTAMNSTMTGVSSTGYHNSTSGQATATHNATATFGSMPTSTTASMTGSTGISTNAPSSNNAVTQVGSSAALVVGVVAAMMCLH